MRILAVLATILFSIASGLARAADYCVDTGAELAAALAAAAGSGEDDIIRLEAGSVTLPAAVSQTVLGNLQIIGGFSAGCVLVSSASSRTSINAAPGTGFRLDLRSGDPSLLRLRFNDFTSVLLTDTAYGPIFNLVTGQVLVQRTAFVGNGLRLVSNHHDVRVEDCLFRDNPADGGNILTGAGLSFERSTDADVDIGVELINNTAVGNKNGFVVAATVAWSTVPVLGNNVVYDNRVSDLVLRLPVRVEYSLWVSQDLSSGGALAGGSGNNLASNPQLDANLEPIAPDSPLINSGDNTPVGGLPSSDYDGGKRLVGTRVDRGAYESNVNDSPVLTVTSAANSGAGTLRQAILDANTSPDEQTIEFNITGACPRVITVTTALPPVTAPLTIAGYSQPGSVQNTDARAFNGTLCIAPNGGGTVATGLHFQTNAGQAMTVEGLAFYGFTSEGLLLTGAGTGFVRGNGFGTGAAALIAVPGFTDAAIRVQDAVGSEIGGTDVATRNVIARGAQAGIRLEAASGGRLVKGNLIGFDTTGTVDLGNGIGITVEGSDRDVITKNLIGFSGTRGICVSASATPAQRVVITANDLGISATFGDAGNGGNGARIEAGSEHAFQFNQVRNNDTDGVVVLAAARRVDFYTNGISNNTLQAIDLSPNGVNPIDLDVGATGANDQQNFPTLTGASGTPDAGKVSGNLSSANGTYLIQFFRTAGCDPDGYGEAQGWIGQTTAVISNAGAGNGSVFFTGDVFAPSATLTGFDITAIATDEEGNSSEVSACVPYRPGLIFENSYE